MRDRPHLLILTSSFPRGPHDETCGYIREFARQLSKDFEVRVLAPPDASAVAWPEDDFVLMRSRSPVPERLDWFQAARDLNDLSRASLIVKIASLFSMACFFFAALGQARKADVICSHWMVPSGLTGALCSLLFGKPHIVIEHSGGLHLLARLPGGRLVARFIVSRSRRVVTVSSQLREKLLALDPTAVTKTEVIPMGACLASQSLSAQELAADDSTKTGGSKTALFIGRLTEIKGVEVLLRAVSRIKEIELLVAGEGERRVFLEDLAARLSTKTSFLGQVGAVEKAGLLARCDFVVIPSLVFPDGRAEGLPVVCLESLAAGRPVIASRSGGLREIIVDGYNGLLFDPGDPASLASTIKRLIDDPDLQKRLSTNARLTAPAYLWEIIGKRYAASIMSAIGKDD